MSMADQFVPLSVTFRLRYIDCSSSGACRGTRGCMEVRVKTQLPVVESTFEWARCLTHVERLHSRRLWHLGMTRQAKVFESHENRRA